MNSSILLFAGLSVLAILVLVLILKKRSSGKPPAAEPEEIPPQPTEEQPPATEEEEEIEAAAIEAVAEKEGTPEPVPSGPEETTAEIAAEPAVPEKTAAEVVEEEEKPAPVAEEQPAVTLSFSLYEQRLVTFKKQRLDGLAAIAEQENEQQREQLHAELVVITEALNFLESSYENELACRNQVLAAMVDMELEAEEYDQCLASLAEGDTLVAGQVLDDLAARDPSLAARAAYLSGRLAECRVALNEAMERYEQAVTLDNGNPEYLQTASALARRLYHHKKALAWSRRLVELLENGEEDTMELARARRDLAYTTALVGQHKQAGGLYKQAMVSLTRLKGSRDPEMGICWLQIGKLQEAMGQYEKADDAYAKALAIMEQDENQVVLGEILEKLAGLYMELEREKEAIPLLERLCELKKQSSHPDRASQIMAYNNLAEAWRISGGYAEAEENYLHSLAITEKLRGPDHPAVGSILQELAQLCQRQGKKEEAEEYRQRAAAIFRRLMDEQEKKGRQAANLTLEE